MRRILSIVPSVLMIRVAGPIGFSLLCIKDVVYELRTTLFEDIALADVLFIECSLSSIIVFDE